VASLYGIRNHCTWTNDVIQPSSPLLTSVTSQYEKKGAPVNGYYAGVFKDWDPSFPWKALVEGYDLLHLTSVNDQNTIGRSNYFYKVFTNVWSKISTVAGTPVVPLDVPGLEDRSIAEFVRLQNNPVVTGHATIRFGLAGADRVQVRIYDVAGRLVRTLADREFKAGEHALEWDGFDRSGGRAARGVYFAEFKAAKRGLEETKKITVLN